MGRCENSKSVRGKFSICRLIKKVVLSAVSEGPGSQVLCAEAASSCSEVPVLLFVLRDDWGQAGKQGCA